MVRLLAPICALVTVLAIARPAEAFEVAGRFGLGYDADLNGVTFRYWFSDLGIDVTVGLGLETKTAAGEKAKFDLMVTPRLVYAFKAHEKLNLNIAGGLYVQVLGSHTAGQADMNVGVFGGFSPEILLLDHLAVEVFFGLAANANNLLKNQASEISFSFGTLGRRISIIGGAIFRYYF
jgi:hypothetical protein